MYTIVKKLSTILLCASILLNLSCNLSASEDADYSNSTKGTQNIDKIFSHINENCGKFEEAATDFILSTQSVKINNILVLDDEIYLPAEQLFTSLQGSINKNLIIIDKESINLKFINNSRIVVVNDIPQVTSLPPVKVDGSLFIPSKSLSEALGLAIELNKAKDAVYINKKYNIPVKNNLEKLFPERKVKGELRISANLYDSVGGKRIKTLDSLSVVEVERDVDYKWYMVKDASGVTGWIAANTLDIDSDYKTNSDTATKEEIEFFINYKGFTSKTQYLVWVDLSRQKINLMKRNNNSWSLYKTFSCATGKNISPTVKGEFEIKPERGMWMYAHDGIKVKYFVRFFESYYFHSILLNSNGSINNPSLGKPMSKGCIRMSLDNAEWFYNNVPQGTKVFIN